MNTSVIITLIYNCMSFKLHLGATVSVGCRRPGPAIDKPATDHLCTLCQRPQQISNDHIGSGSQCNVNQRHTGSACTYTYLYAYTYMPIYIIIIMFVY